MSTIPRHFTFELWAWGSLNEWKTTWTLHDIKWIMCQGLLHQISYLVSYGILCHNGKLYNDTSYELVDK